MMTNLLEKARSAAQERDWANLSQYLQQALLPDHFSNPAVINPAGYDVADFLPLALVVLEAGSFQDKWDVAKVLPQFGEGAIMPLVALLQDGSRDLETRWFAARCLANFDHFDAVQALAQVLVSSGDDDLSNMAANALATIGPSAISSLASMLTQSETCLAATQALAQIGHPATVDVLLPVTKHPDPEVRQIAIRAISSFQDDRALEILQQSVTDPVASVRQVSLVGLSSHADQIPASKLVPLLADRLWDINAEVCQQAAIALSRVGNPAVEPLMRVLQSPLSPISLQLESVRSLGWIGSEVALKHLAQVLHTDMPSDLKQEIVAILGRWAEPGLKPKATLELVQFLQTHGLTSQNPGLQQAIAHSLGQLGEASALAPLIQLLQVDDLGVQLHVIAALKQLDAGAAYQQLKILAAQPQISDGLQQGVTIALQEW